MRYFKYLSKDSIRKTTAKMIADALNLNVVLVRNDLTILCPSEKRKTNYDIDELIQNMSQYINTGNITPVVVVGAGKLGKALLGYGGFMAYDIDVVAAFDINPKVLSKKDQSGKPIYHIKELMNICTRLKPKVGVITVPGNSAQSVCNQLIDAGIISVWNFTSTEITVPKGIFLKNENLSHTLVQLANYII